MTGEVVTGTEERLATGDAVNVAARLEQAAQPGEVLIGEPTLALVRDAAEVEPVEPLELKGKCRAGSRLSAPARARRAGAPARARVRRPRARARDPAGGLGARAGGEALRAGHGRRRCRRGQVPARRGGAGSIEATIIARPLPALRRGDHVLAGRRGAEAARRAACRRGRRGGDPRAARRDRGGDVARRRSPGRSARRWSTPRQSGRWWSSSTTSSGASRRSST